MSVKYLGAFFIVFSFLNLGANLFANDKETQTSFFQTASSIKDEFGDNEAEGWLNNYNRSEARFQYSFKDKESLKLSCFEQFQEAAIKISFLDLADRLKVEDFGVLEDFKIQYQPIQNVITKFIVNPYNKTINEASIVVDLSNANSYQSETLKISAF
ncbi:MAG: hypothetical protein FWE18_04540 [Alphaproteobacteria bacterium]|nr:hypothetical protein [Alphaproteobacteria bacterium]